jgi:hypothetical protein
VHFVPQRGSGYDMGSLKIVYCIQYSN